MSAQVAVGSIPEGASGPGRGASPSVRRGPTIGDATPLRSPHLATVVTPEAVLLEFRAAGIASRMLAKMIDVLIQGAATFGLIILLGIFATVNGTASLVIGLVGVFLIVFGYPTIEAFWSGQTVGKRALGLRVISVEGTPITLRHAAVRSIIGAFEFLLPPGGLPAVVSALVSRRSQRIGDLAAGTVVVRDHKTKTEPVFWPPPRGAEPFAFTFDAGRLTPIQYGIIREFLRRAHELNREDRRLLSFKLAAQTEIWSAWPRPREVAHEPYLLAAAFAYQRRYATASLR